jgi:hypothetical protein
VRKRPWFMLFLFLFLFLLRDLEPAGTLLLASCFLNFLLLLLVLVGQSSCLLLEDKKRRRPALSALPLYVYYHSLPSLLSAMGYSNTKGRSSAGVI